MYTMAEHFVLQLQAKGHRTHLFLGKLLGFLRATTDRVLVRLKEVMNSVVTEIEGGRETQVNTDINEN